MTLVPPASTTLRAPLETVMDARAHNLTQSALIYDPSPAEDSLAECILGLLHADDAHDRANRVAETMVLLRRLTASNVLEGECELSAAGVLDAMTKGMHCAGVRSQMTVREAAARLRRPLRAIAENPDGIAFFRHACQIKDVVSLLSPDVLHGNGLRNELGTGRHDLLLSMLPTDGAGAEVAA